MSRKQHFEPVVDDRTRVLILGSLPGEASLAAGQYYANPRNSFWALVSDVADRELVSLSYPDRLSALKAAGIGLWDVVAEADRAGSLDSAIRQPVHADLAGLVATLPDLQAVAFNGGAAARAGHRILDGRTSATLLTLPSSSPALAKPLAWKGESWAVLKAFLLPAPDR